MSGFSRGHVLENVPGIRISVSILSYVSETLFCSSSADGCSSGPDKKAEDLVRRGCSRC